MQNCLGTPDLAALASSSASDPTHAAHVASCAICRRRLDALRETLAPRHPSSGPGFVATALTASPALAHDATAAGAAPVHGQSLLSQGAHIGRHVVTRPLGAGAMGVVYEARDPELDRNVAIKLLRHDRYAGDEGMIARLKREARALAQLAHPNVVAIHDVGIHDGAPFIAMEHVHGMTLRAWLDATPRSWREIVRVFEGAARGLAAAHSTGLIHRDFKPDNVMLGDDGRVRVMDFGLARTEGATESSERRPVGQLDELMTASGAVIGTPAYMAPEQFDGKPADARSDQYNFMVSLYEALAGKRPFTGRTLAELSLAVTDGTPTPLPSRVPRALRDLVMRGLARDPAGRHRDLDSVLAALAKLQQRTARLWLAGGGGALALSAVAIVALTRGDELSACEVGARRIDRHWDSRALKQVATQFTSTRSAGAASAASDAAKALDDYSQRWKRLSRETCEARGSLNKDVVEQRHLCLDGRLRGVEALVSLWQETRDPMVVAAAPSAVFALPSVTDCATANAALTPRTLTREQTAAVDRSRSRLAAARARLTSGAGADAALAEIREVTAQATAIGIDAVSAEAELTLASALHSVGLVLEARDAFVRARQHAERAGDRVTAAESRIRELGAMLAAGEIEAAGTVARDAETALQAAGTPERLRTLFLRNRGQLQLLQRETDKAATDLEASYEQTVALFGAESLEAAESKRLLGSIAFDRRDRDGARKHWSEALAIVERLHGAKHPLIAHIRMNLCDLDVNKDPAAARVQCDAARAFFETAGPSFRGQLARALSIGAPLAGEQQQEQLERARETLKETAGGASLEIAEISGQLASLHFDARRFAKAAEELEHQLAMLERVHGREHATIAERLGALGRSYQLSDKPDKAMAAYERALAIREKHPADPAALMGALMEVGNLQSMMNNPAAIKTLERAIAIATQGVPDPSGQQLGNALIMVGSHLTGQGNYEPALRYLDRASAVKHPQTRLYAIAGRATTYASMGKRREAERDIAMANRLVRKLPNDRSFVLAGTCQAYQQLRDWQRALRPCRAAAEQMKDSPPLHAMLTAGVAECQLELGKVKPALATLEELAKLDPIEIGAPPTFRTELMFVVARARFAAGDEAGALAAADESERGLITAGLEGRRTLAQLQAWRAKHEK